MYIVEIKNGEIVTQIHGLKEKLKSGSVVKGINTIDSFSLSMFPNNAGFNLIKDLQTLVSVYNTNKNRYEFYGRFLYSKGNMDSSGKITKEAICESYLGFLCDSVQEYVEERNWTQIELLQHILDVHNSQVEPHKRFMLGEVTVIDPNNNLYVGIQRENSWNTIKTKLLDKLGGEITFRVVDDVIYLDYLEKIGERLTTEIALSKNMKSITREDNPSAYISRLIPLGAKIKDEEGQDTEERVDITSVNNGVNYIESAEAVAKFGIRYGYVMFDDVTQPSNLLSKGQEYLANNNKVQVKYSIDSLDLSLLGLDINDFERGNYHPIKNALLGIDDTARIIKKTIDVCDEIKTTIEVGDNFKTLSDLEIERDNAIKDTATKIESTKNELQQTITDKNTQTNSDLREVIVQNNTEMINTCENIIFSAMSSYTESGDFETFKQTVESQLKLLSDNMTLKFTETTKELNKINGDLQEKFNTITKHFTFDINGLTIGQVDNPYKVIIDNDRYSMTVNGVEVMWIADGKVYTKEIEITSAMKLFGYLIDQDDFGNVNCSYVGGDK